MSLLDIFTGEIKVIENNVIDITPEDKSSRAAPYAYHRDLGESWVYMAENSLKTDFLSKYKKVEWIYACIDAIATSLSSVPIKVYRIKNRGGENSRSNRATNNRLITRHKSILGMHDSLIEGNDKLLNKKISDIEEVVDGDLVDVLENINPDVITSAFRSTTTIHLELKGNSFWELVGAKQAPISSNNPPVEIYLLNPNHVFIVPDSKEYIKGYIYIINDKQITFERDEILHQKYPDPIREHYGQGSVEVLLNTIAMDEDAVEYNKRFFKQGSRPDGVLQTDTRLADSVYERVKDSWEARYAGKKNAHKVAILEQGLKYMPIGISQREADFIETRKMSRETIMAVLGTYPSVMGLKTTNFATAQIENKLYWGRTVRPKGKMMDETLNKGFVPYYGNDLYVEHDFSDIEALKIDKSEEHARYFNIGALSQNDIREELNKPLSDNGNILYVSPQLVPVGTTDGSEISDNFNEDENEDMENEDE